MEPVANQNQILEISPDVFKPKTSDELMKRPVVPGFDYIGAGVGPSSSLSSRNYISDSSGWGIISNGDAQFNGNHVVSGHFTPVIKLLGLTVYVSDTTSPNGNLTGGTGDICFGADNGKAYKCTGGTSWVSFT